MDRHSAGQNEVHRLGGFLKSRRLAEQIPAFLNRHVSAAEQAKLFPFGKGRHLFGCLDQFGDNISNFLHRSPRAVGELTG